jgi:hypothetical protein
VVSKRPSADGMASAAVRDMVLLGVGGQSPSRDKSRAW